ncbi:MAG: MFS transporter [Nocardioidaceae bacterium]
MALAVYVLAVFHRSSLAVAGLVAADRFGISAAQLATFTMLQLLVYAGMQVPVGLLVDRFGPRTVLTTGALVMAAAQTGFALADSYVAALVARAFVGVGDALTFICVLRLVSSWFAPRRVPVMVQLTGMLGQLGGIAAAVPMTWALGQLGWTRSYLIGAVLGIVVVMVLVVVVHDTPEAVHTRGHALRLSTVRRTLAAAWEHPGTRLGFWMHFTAPFSANVTTLLWGFPFFVQGEGATDAEAGVLLTVMVVAVMIAGPVIGWRTSARPWHRSTLVLGIVVAIVTSWTVVLVWPGQAPFPVLVLLVVITGLGGPASAIGFDLGRTSNPSQRLGSATGLINQGGFISSLVAVLAVGLILDWRTPGGGSSYPPGAFKAAMSCQYVLWALGITQIARYRVKTRARLRRDDPEQWAEMSGETA